jgi:transposase InsO family protein
MSKARLVITAVLVEGRTQSEVAGAYGVSQPWISRLLARYRAEGEAAFEPRSRRPRRSPTATPPDVVELVLRLRKELTEQGLDAGPHTICWHLEHHHRQRLSPATVHRILTRHGLVTAEPKKRPKSSYTRFEADLPNQTWQTDFTHVRLDDGTTTGRDVEVLNFLDDHSRYLLASTAYSRVTGPAVAKAFLATIAAHGVPASVLSDNGMVFTTRFAGNKQGKGGKNAFEKELRRLHVVQKNSSPNHPQTCGKIERLHQTQKKWLTAQPDQPTTIDELQAQLDAFRDQYNHHRPHRALNRRTPAVAYTARPKAAPAGTRTDTHDRVRRDRIDDSGVVTLRHNGRLHHIGIGRTHARTHVLLLIQDLNIRVIHAATGELLRELTLDPTRDYQARGRPPRQKQ